MWGNSLQVFLRYRIKKTKTCLVGSQWPWHLIIFTPVLSLHTCATSKCLLWKGLRLHDTPTASNRSIWATLRSSKQVAENQRIYTSGVFSASSQTSVELFWCFLASKTQHTPTLSTAVVTKQAQSQGNSSKGRLCCSHLAESQHNIRLTRLIFHFAVIKKINQCHNFVPLLGAGSTQRCSTQHPHTHLLLLSECHS